jgi:tetratricopeptide (TPR) repeat protein
MYNLETIIDENIANSLSDLADTYREKGRPKMAKKLYLNALKLRERLSIVKEDYYQSLVAKTLNSLAVVSIEENRYNLAIEYYLASIGITELLFNNAPEKKYIKRLIKSYTEIANIYRREHDYEKSEFFYNEALKNYQKLPKEDLKKYQIKVLNIYNHLSVICNAENKFEATKNAYLGALEIYRSLVNEESNCYRDELGTVLFELAFLYFNNNQQARAEEIYLWTLEILLSLAQKDSNRYREMLAVTLHNLAQIYSTKLEYSNGLSAYRESLKYYIALAGENPIKYSPYMALIFKGLASFYKKQNKMELAQYFHFKAVDSYIELVHYNESGYALKLVSSIIDGVTDYKQHTLSLYQAEAILKSYKEEKEGVLLLEKIDTIREERSYCFQ